MNPINPLNNMTGMDLLGKGKRELKGMSQLMYMTSV